MNETPLDFPVEMMAGHLFDDSLGEKGKQALKDIGLYEMLKTMFRMQCSIFYIRGKMDSWSENTSSDKSSLELARNRKIEKGMLIELLADMDTILANTAWENIQGPNPKKCQILVDQIKQHFNI